MREVWKSEHHESKQQFVYLCFPFGMTDTDYHHLITSPDTTFRLRQFRCWFRASAHSGTSSLHFFGQTTDTLLVENKELLRSETEDQLKPLTTVIFNSQSYCSYFWPRGHKQKIFPVMFGRHCSSANRGATHVKSRCGIIWSEFHNYVTLETYAATEWCESTVALMPS